MAADSFLGGCALFLVVVLLLGAVIVWGGTVALDKLEGVQSQEARVQAEKTLQQRDYFAYLAAMAAMGRDEKAQVPVWFVAYVAVLTLAVIGQAYVTWYERRKRKAVQS